MDEESLKVLWDKIDDIARKKFDGHFSLFKFTTNWMFTFGTVQRIRDYRFYPHIKQEDVDRAYVVYGSTLRNVLEKAIARYNEIDCNSIYKTGLDAWE